MLNLHSNKYKQNTYCLLIINNHKNHKIFKFDVICKKLNIILIYMLLHFFHLLQLLDINFFPSLKKTYIKELENMFQLNVNYINKLKLLKIYKCVQFQVFIKLNIFSVFKNLDFFGIFLLFSIF